MGMFTTIIRPIDNMELQIKSYRDNLDRYTVGDVVDWHIWPDQPGIGTLLDGAYESYSEKGLDDWVIIKDHKVVMLVPRDSAVGRSGEEGLLHYYEIEPFKREWWTEAAWVEEELKKAERSLKDLTQVVEFLRTCRGKSDEEIKALRKKYHEEAAAQFIKDRLAEVGFARQVFNPTKKG